MAENQTPTADYVVCCGEPRATACCPQCGRRLRADTSAAGIKADLVRQIAATAADISKREALLARSDAELAGLIRQRTAGRLAQRRLRLQMLRAQVGALEAGAKDKTG